MSIFGIFNIQSSHQKKQADISDYWEWNYKGLDANLLLNCATSQDVFQQSCSLILNGTAPKSLLDKFILPFREAALAARNKDNIEKVVNFYNEFICLLEEKGFSSPLHPNFNFFGDLLIDNKVSLDVLSEIEDLSSFHQQLRYTYNERLMDYNNFLHQGAGCPEKFLYRAKPLIHELNKTSNLITATDIHRQYDFLRQSNPLGNLALPSRTSLNALRRNIKLFLDISYGDCKTVNKKDVFGLMQLFIHENLKSVEHLEFMSIKGSPRLLRDFHEWALYLGEDKNKNYHRQKFHQYDAMVNEILMSLGTPLSHIPVEIERSKVHKYFSDRIEKRDIDYSFKEQLTMGSLRTTLKKSFIEDSKFIKQKYLL